MARALTEVIHLRDAPSKFQDDPRYVYIGRARPGFDGYFGNPYPVKGGARASTLARYYRYLQKRVDEDEIFRQRVKRLCGLTLVCYCAGKPLTYKDRPWHCHGQILAYFADVVLAKPG